MPNTAAANADYLYQTQWFEKAYKPPTPFACAMEKVAEAKLLARQATIALCTAKTAKLLTDDLRTTAEAAHAQLDEALLAAYDFAKGIPQVLYVYRNALEGSRAQKEIFAKMAGRAGWH